MNINVEIFKKYKPEKKLHMINNLTNSELLQVNTITIIRIIKEVGYGHSSETKCHNKSLRLKNTIGNNWNSDVEEIYIYKKVPYISFYLQYDNTDTGDSDKLVNFLGRGEYLGNYTYEDRYGNHQTTYYRYDEEDKARVIKEILLTYIHNKYSV